MQSEEVADSSNSFYWSTDPQNPFLKRRTLFLSISSDFKFKESISLNAKTNLLVFHGQLVFNNGATVSLSISHDSLINHFLNSCAQPGKLIFAMDQNS